MIISPNKLFDRFPFQLPIEIDKFNHSSRVLADRSSMEKLEVLKGKEEKKKVRKQQIRFSMISLSDSVGW
jgi:hypothetical protein